MLEIYLRYRMHLLNVAARSTSCYIYGHSIIQKQGHDQLSSPQQQEEKEPDPEKKW
jgi:hypothetical protein